MEVPGRGKEMRGKKRVGQLEKEMMGKDERGCGTLPFRGYLKLPGNIICFWESRASSKPAKRAKSGSLRIAKTR